MKIEQYQKFQHSVVQELVCYVRTVHDQVWQRLPVTSRFETFSSKSGIQYLCSLGLKPIVEIMSTICYLDVRLDYQFSIQRGDPIRKKGSRKIKEQFSYLAYRSENLFLTLAHNILKTQIHWYLLEQSTQKLTNA